jgi:hypothetical protein
MSLSRLAIACLSFALLLAGCVGTPRERPEGRSEAAAPGQKHEVTLIIDGKVAGQWTTTGKIEVNGSTFNGTDSTPPPPALRELPQ